MRDDDAGDANGLQPSAAASAADSIHYALRTLFDRRAQERPGFRVEVREAVAASREVLNGLGD